MWSVIVITITPNMGFSDNMFLEKQNNPGLEVDLIDEISIQEINIIFKENWHNVAKISHTEIMT